LDPLEHRRLFDAYFSIFPFDDLPPGAEGFDLGCGSGRWAALMLERVGMLHCIDPSPKALAVAQRRLGSNPNARFQIASSETIPLADNSQDFGYALGVLHHIPNTMEAMKDCARKLRSGAPFLVYLYYRFENRPSWFKQLWRVSESGRTIISRLPFPLRKAITNVIAAAVYLPLARSAKLLERTGFNVSAVPLSSYRNYSFYTMRTDALDRFGTRLEQRFTRSEIDQMMKQAGFTDIQFRESEPFWIACGRKVS
jgi:ubiquinone/menaquinone biosynthesis C-methylase UbiE